MSDAPKTIWTCTHVGEYGHYFPDAVEAEGEYGGTAVEYTLTSSIAAQLKAADELAEASAIVNDILLDFGREDILDKSETHGMERLWQTLTAYRKAKEQAQ